MSMTTDERRKWAYEALDRWLKNHEAHELLVHFDNMFSDVGESLGAVIEDQATMQAQLTDLDHTVDRMDREFDRFEERVGVIEESLDSLAS